MKTIVYVMIASFAWTVLPPKGMADNPTDSMRISALQVQVQQLSDTVSLYKSIKLKEAESLEMIAEVHSYFQKPWQTLLKIFGIGGIILIALFFAFWKLLNWLMPNWYVKIIQRLVERFEEVNVLKKKKSILILSPSECANQAFIDSFFKEKEFNVAEPLTVTGYEKPAKEYDIFFVNNENGKLAQEEMEKYLEKHKDACMLYFGPPGSWDFKRNAELNKRLNLVNSRSQIYGNLISTLKFHDLITPKVKL